MRGQEKQFTNVRVRLQRIGELHAYYGWVERFQAGFVSVWLPESEEIQVGQRYYFEIYGMESSIAFEGLMEGYADSRVSIAKSDGEPASEVCYGFQIHGSLQIQPSKEDCRRFVGGLKATVMHRQEEMDVQLIDISPHGAGIRMPARPRIGDPISLQLRVPGKRLAIQGYVRYARRDACQPDHFRVGVRFDSISEEDRKSWNDVVMAA